MPFTKSIANSLLGKLAKPLAAPAFTLPVLKQSTVLTAVTTGRGAFVPAQNIIYYAISGTNQLLRWDVINNVQLANLQLVGSPFAVRGCVFNPSDGFLYSADAVPEVLKINPATGNIVSIIPTTLHVTSDMVYSPVNQCVFFCPASGDATQALTRIDTAGTVTQSAAQPPGTALTGLEYAAVSSKIIATTNKGSALYVATGGMGFVSAENAKTWLSASFSPNTGNALLGDGATDPRLVIYNQNGTSFANVAAFPAGVFESGGYSSIHGVHFMVDITGGICYFFADTDSFPQIGSQAVGANAGTSPQDSLPIVANNKVYVITTGTPKMNVFT